MKQPSPSRTTRRGLLAGAAAIAAAPRMSHAQRRDPRVLRFIPNTGLTVLDPVWTASLVTGNHAYHVFDTLYGTGSDWKPAPQMAAGHTAEDDWRTWTIRLRDDLWFHDGTPVLARDCAASIKRWARRDSFGAAMMVVNESIDAPDDRTILFHMRHNKVWKNTLVNECAGLKNNANGFVYEPTKQVNGEICENFQSIILADNGNTCLLGSFTEVSAR